MSADLFTVAFLAKNDFSSDTVINFTGNPAVGYSFVASSATIAYKDTTVAVFEDAATSSTSPSVNWHYVSTMDTGIHRYDGSEDLITLTANTFGMIHTRISLCAYLHF